MSEVLVFVHDLDSLGVWVASGRQFLAADEGHKVGETGELLFERLAAHVAGDVGNHNSHLARTATRKHTWLLDNCGTKEETFVSHASQAE